MVWLNDHSDFYLWLDLKDWLERTREEEEIDYFLPQLHGLFFSISIGKAKQERMLYLFRQVQLGLKESNSLQ